MATNTPNLNLNTPDYGKGNWDVLLNDNFMIIDTAIQDAINRGINIIVAPEQPLAPAYGAIWVDTSEGEKLDGVVKGKYKIYNGTVFEEYLYVTDADLVKLSPTSLFTATDVEGALNELKIETDKIPIVFGIEKPTDGAALWFEEIVW